ncbi:MAG: phosphoribosylformimino-5-aminoimidazole carboxamide ribotide isomerase [Petroclostridium sp.]|jgi:phosphoribosylformimino-5-aminoimidazole carboxamide ribotide isomerase|uniref:1-(5-phosphoribosyl)-5-[(5- phosphoribosylamino)methylideneamino]imidazole-4- carboxamide isomerase n=1 Tax=Petroclostridium xylanilyticum TaxID=1792311 RepID=UPI000B9961FE|nr:1-(5-phosphoribosyl)-5-[(5-phosphoribosylamino)methylideneamino]imidazole-4-carboxamide isomerase [Petroclostridium xylanilyticum]MBZ4644995.1 1-(5-phosphoribosyl)-5-((5-phosphoribosylamino)methylideneamino) imidazole-4-carboxamide isomerase [Clostridia bacterium]MDK2810078.1 phosphoribosylformimino-5-aminoimidazole carboxamide ribotide isomerase [Petroclostridium sp.]
MVIYPAIDIKQGKCVRLVQGKFSDVTVYSDNPVQMAKKWEQLGAKYIHLVDLDGALTGQSVNSEIIKEIVKSVSIPVQLGGGIRTIENIKSMLDNGVTRVILGTSAVRNPLLVKEAAAQYKERIVVGIDAKDGKVAIEGWEKVSDFSAVSFAKKMQEIGVKTIVYTDISRDGMLKGPNIAAMKEMVDSLAIDVIASGGVSSLSDIKELKKTGVEGVIVGKALYTGNVSLVEALEVAKE